MLRHRINSLQSGPWALLEAMFVRARRDAKSNSRYRLEAEQFLFSQGTVDNLAALGVDPDHYRSLLDSIYASA